MIKNSLNFRILISSTVVALIAAILAAYFLTKAFESSIEKRFDETLKSNLNDLIAALSFDQNGKLILDWRPSDPRFNAPISGWYWLICDQKDNIIHQSDSLVQIYDHQLIPADKSKINTSQFNQTVGPGEVELRTLIRNLKNDQNQSFYLTITGPVSDIEDDVAAFFKQLLITLSILLLGFLAITYFQIKLALSPLDQAKDEIAAIRGGQLKKLDENYPNELMPFVQEINELLTDNESIISKARLQASNLAHALKNPLTIIKNESTGQNNQTINQQVNLLNQQIDRHLHKVRIAGNLDHSSALTNVSDCLQEIVYSLEVLYKEKSLSFDINCQCDFLFRGDSQDLEEMLGNLLDNAAKWATNTVTVSVELKESILIFNINDDGPGIDDTHKHDIFSPGKRLDENVQGSGLGLYIVNQIVEQYKGKIRVLSGDFSGTKIKLELPGSR